MHFVLSAKQGTCTCALQGRYQENDIKATQAGRAAFLYSTAASLTAFPVILQSNPTIITRTVNFSNI